MLSLLFYLYLKLFPHKQRNIGGSPGKDVVSSSRSSPFPRYLLIITHGFLGRFLIMEVVSFLHG
jgi:hypothetical protein